MSDKDLIIALRRMAVETGSFVCLGCNCEHSCSLHGCAIIKEAVARLESLMLNGTLKALDLFAEATKGVPLNRVRELAQAEKDGRLVVLPCKVGDAIYWADIYMGQKDIEEYQVEEIDPTIIFKGHTYIQASRIGKNYFLTREEAEAALKKKEDIK